MLDKMKTWQMKMHMKESSMKYRFWVIAVFIIMLLSTGCGKNNKVEISLLGHVWFPQADGCMWKARFRCMQMPLCHNLILRLREQKIFAGLYSGNSG